MPLKKCGKKPNAASRPAAFVHSTWVSACGGYQAQWSPVIRWLAKPSCGTVIRSHGTKQLSHNQCRTPNMLHNMCGVTGNQEVYPAGVPLRRYNQEIS